MGLFNNSRKTLPKKRTILSIEVGDIVSYDLTDYEVIGKIIYRNVLQDSYRYQLFDGKNTIWLQAGMDEDLKVAIYHRISFAKYKNYPEKIRFDHQSFRLYNKRSVRMLGKGRCSQLEGMLNKYADYVSDKGDTLLRIESWGTEQIASLGYSIQPVELKIIAGSF